jgi:plastocyanin
MKLWCLGLCVVLGTLFWSACGSDDTAQKAPSSTPASTQPTTQPSAETPRVVDVTLSFITPRFRPDPVVVQVGKPVQFRLASTDTRHHIVIEALGIDLEVPQKSQEESVLTRVVTPPETGTFRMFCRIHSRMPMEGTLQVTDTGVAEK